MTDVEQARALCLAARTMLQETAQWEAQWRSTNTRYRVVGFIQGFCVGAALIAAVCLW